MAAFTPVLKTKGLWSLKAPYDAILLKDVEYTCTRIATISDLVAEGIDVFEEFYAPVQLTQTDLDNDTKADADIITLQSAIGDKVTFPSTYLANMPDINGVPHMGFMLAVDLALLPSNFDFSYVSQRLKEVTLATIGFDPTITPVATTVDKLFSQEQSALMASTRQANIVGVDTDYTNLLKARAEIATLRDQIRILNDYIAANRPST